MTAVLRYALLKSWRDRSLVAFMVWPVLSAVGPWTAMTLQRHVGARMGPSPDEVVQISGMIGAMTGISLASMFAFWTFRGEVATRAIGAFLFATRPLTVIASLIVFGTLGGLASTLIAEGTLGVLIGGIPPIHLGSVVLRVVVSSFTGAALGALAVTISSQPTMMIGALWATYGILTIPLIVKSESIERHVATLPEYVYFVAVAIMATGLAAFLLERRCAT
ncbi:MAG TPA: hypothetical protein VFB20_05510 [Burkholderiales bacterium]|nr:hypothetical protein [Burkholderiales bacterium]